MKPNQSIYAYIKEALTAEDTLPANFSLPEEDGDPNQLLFSPGAMDGIGAFHMGGGNFEEAAKEVEGLLRKVLVDKKPSITEKLFMQNRRKKDLEKIAVLLKTYGVLPLIDPILHGIRQNHEDIDPSNMITLAATFAFESNEVNAVKLGVALLGLMALEKKPEIVEKLLTLALYEEFTLYVAAALNQCENGNALLFDLGKKVRGWGKIHVVERLEPETEEIRQWLLCYGCENGVVNGYLALVCAEKGNLIETLRMGDFDDALFRGISVIMNGFLDEESTDGMSAYEDAEEALLLYLTHAKKRDILVFSLWTLVNIQDWLEACDLDNRAMLMALCKESISQKDWAPMLIQAVKKAEKPEFFCAVSVAGRLGIDILEDLFEVVKENHVKYVTYISSLYTNATYAVKLTDIYEKILSLDKMEQGMGDDLFAHTLGEEHYCLDFVLDQLGGYPNLGEPLLRTALLSPVTRERYGTIQVLESWCCMLDQPLLVVSPNLNALVEDVVTREVDDELKDRMNRLLFSSRILSFVEDTWTIE